LPSRPPALPYSFCWRNAMLALLTTREIEKHGRRYGRWTPMMRKLRAYATAVVARLKDFAPYAL
jgi:hypothetical protein